MRLTILGPAPLDVAFDPIMSSPLAVTREQEIWAVVLWVEHEHGEDSEQFIAERVLHFDAEGDVGGKQLWMDVARRYIGLRSAANGEVN